MLSDEEEKENLSPGEVPTTVVVDSFGKTFEDAVSICLVLSFCCHHTQHASLYVYCILDASLLFNNSEAGLKIRKKRKMPFGD